MTTPIIYDRCLVDVSLISHVSKDETCRVMFGFCSPSIFVTGSTQNSKRRLCQSAAYDPKKILRTYDETDQSLLLSNSWMLQHISPVRTSDHAILKIKQILREQRYMMILSARMKS
jgi:hypothetical protein